MIARGKDGERSADAERGSHLARPSAVNGGAHATAGDRLVSMQRSIGNALTAELLRSGLLQAKLAVSRPDDPLEIEADRVADDLMRDVGSSATPRGDGGAPLEVDSAAEADVLRLQGGGEPLPDQVLELMEPRFGVDFGQVRVHTGPDAVRSAEGIGARAYTLGSNIVFGAGEYAPSTSAGQRLLAHELAHVVQQGAGPGIVARRETTPADAARMTNDERAALSPATSAILPEPPERTAPTQVEENVEAAGGEESFTTEQTLRSEKFKTDHVEHSTGNEVAAGQNGHLDEWMTEKHTVKKSGSDYVVTIDALDIHTRVFVWPENTPGWWNRIADFGPYYDKPYDPGFNLYQGTLRHEKQHAVEASDAFKAHEAWFRGEVAKIKQPTSAAAQAEYTALFAAFRTRQQTTYWANGEADGQRIEWDYYHGEFEKFAGDPLTYGLFDWAITDADALKVLTILDDLEKRGVPGFEKMVNYLKTKGLLDRLLDNISEPDKKTYKVLISKMYLLL